MLSLQLVSPSERMAAWSCSNLSVADTIALKTPNRGIDPLGGEKERGRERFMLR
jgi:hypothetical protein